MAQNSESCVTFPSTCIIGLPFCEFVTCMSMSPLEPLTVLNSFFSPVAAQTESAFRRLPSEDQYYLVGTVCIIKPQTLRVSILCVCLLHCDNVGFLWRAMSLLVIQPLGSVAKTPNLWMCAESCIRMCEWGKNSSCISKGEHLSRDLSILERDAQSFISVFHII